MDNEEPLESQVTLNGWHRLLIVMATAWVLAVVGFTALEFHASEGETGDGIFTCWEPTGSQTPHATRYWNRDCGIFPRTSVATGFFDDLPPWRRYLNTPRFLAVLLGPGVLVGLCIVAARWVVSGFRTESFTKVPAQSSLRTPPKRLDPPVPSRALAWLNRLPLRWARNAAKGGAVLTVPGIVPLLSNGDGATIAFMLAGLGVVVLGSAGAGYACGLWARWGLAAPFALSPASALTRITSNWLTGAILLAALVLAGDALFEWRRTTPLLSDGISFRDLGYLTGFFGSWVLAGYLIALRSKRGLTRAVDADRKAAS